MISANFSSTAVGVNPEYAIGALKNAADEVAAEAKAKFGDAEPPDGWLPLALLNIDPAYLLGFAWIVARREAPTLTFDGYSEEVEAGELMEAFYGNVGEEAEEAAPLAEPAPLNPRKSPSAAKLSSPSASSTAGA